MKFIARHLDTLIMNVGWVIVLGLISLPVSAQYNVERLLLSGKVALHYEDYVLSIQYFNQAINQKPYLWEPWQLRAISKYYLEDWQGTEDDATVAIQLNPYITSLYDLRGISRIKQHHYEDAIADYTKAISLDANNKGFWYNRAACYVESKNYEAAKLQIDTIVSRWSNYAPAYLMMTEVLLNSGDTVNALKWLDDGLKIEPHNGEAWRMKAYIAFSKEQWSEAEQCFGKSLHYKPKDVPSYINRALARLRLNNLRGAMSDYDTAIELAPNNFLAHYNRGLLRQNVGDYNRAIEDFDYVLEIEPGNIMALFNRATLLDQVGELRKAIRDYSAVIDKFPNFWTGLSHRAACYRKLGQIAKAEKDEFRIFKAQNNKHLGIQQRWSSKKLAAMRKLSDIDPEKYNQFVVEDASVSDHEYKSEYRGKVQNRQVTEYYQPYIALTCIRKTDEVKAQVYYDNNIDSFLEHLRAVPGMSDLQMPILGNVGEGTGTSTFELVDAITSLMDKQTDVKTRKMLALYRSIAYSSAQNYQEALNDIDKVLDDGDDVVALWQKAICMAMIAEYEHHSSQMDASIRGAAIMEMFKQLKTKTGETPILLYNEGSYYARKGEYAKAVELFTRAIDMDNQFSYAYYNRGLVYMHTKETNKAKLDFGKAGELGLYGAYSLLKKQK